MERWLLVCAFISFCHKIVCVCVCACVCAEFFSFLLILNLGPGSRVMPTGVYNPGNEPHDVFVDISQAFKLIEGRPHDTGVFVRDVWNKQSLGFFKNFTANQVGIHETRFLKFSVKG